MAPSLDSVLRLISDNIPGLMGLESDKERIRRTLEALSLQEGESYISMGIGKNVLPILVAIQGINVVGVDIDGKAQ